jgi:hypothetical protein
LAYGDSALFQGLRTAGQHMSIGINMLRLLIDLKTRGYIPGGSSVMDIGAQQLDQGFLAHREELGVMGRLFGIERPCPLPPPLSQPSIAGLDPEAPSARQFWAWLGLSYAALDIDGSPGSVALDLNYDEAPSELRGKHHLVTNFGTTEHVANQCQAFKVVHDLTVLGGVMMHNVPVQGMLNHGLVNYNPKFFWMLARSNGYKWLHMDFRISNAVQTLSADIIHEVAAFSPDIVERSQRYCAQICSFVVVMQKTTDMPYVPPLDVNTGAQTDNKILEMRYPTVFKP